MEVIAVDLDALLAGDETEARAKFKQEALHLAKDRGFKVLLVPAVLEAKKVQHVGITQYQPWRQLLVAAQCRQLFGDGLLWLTGECRALIQHRIDALAQRTYTPALGGGHLCIEVALEWVRQWDQRDEMGPAQLSYQRYDNLLVCKCDGELHHPAQALLTEGCAELGRQRLGDPGEENLSVARTSPSHLVHMDATPDSPVQQSELGVDGPVHPVARRADQLSETLQGGICGR